MNLHENEEQFRDSILATAQLLGIPEIYVEKDYWVTMALKLLFQSELAEDYVFKGGTALAKCYRLIERFSEDIDLVVVRKAGESNNQLTKKIKRATEIVSRVLPEVQVEGITNKKGQIRKTVHAYRKTGVSGEFGQVRSNIVLEASWLGHFEPYRRGEVGSYIAEMMLGSGLEHLIGQFGLESFAVNVLQVERTFCEKIMSLVRWSRTADPYQDLSNKVRHIYDIHRMLDHTGIRTFFEGDDFPLMLLRVGKDDLNSFNNGTEWLLDHPRTALIFEKREETWGRLRPTYETAFRELVIGQFPTEHAMLESLEMVHRRLEAFAWKLN